MRCCHTMQQKHMRTKILTQLSHSPLVKILQSAPVPRWMVLVADMMIVVLCAFLTFFFNGCTQGEGFMFAIPVKASIIASVYLAMDLWLKSYQYIIRLSIIEDVYRLTLLVLASSVFSVTSTIVLESVTGIRYFSIWNIFIIGMFSFSIMMCMRLLIKYIYTLITDVGNTRKPVIVLGSAINSFVLANALKNEVEGRFDPVALLSLSDKNAGTTINGIPIILYSQDSIKEIFDKFHCDTLLFLSTQIDLMRGEFADVFFNNHIKLLMLNQVEEFDANDNSMPNLSTHVRNIRIEDLLGRDPILNDNPHINRLIRNQVVMITGAAGSIGSEIVRQVAQFGAKEIVLVDQAETPMHYMQLEMEERFPDTAIHLFIGNITNRQRMDEAFSLYHPKYVFHAAAYKHVPMMEHNPSEAIFTNVFGTKNLADLSVAHGVEKFVMISTDKAVNPTNIMGASKRIAEIYVQSLFFHLQKNNKVATRFITTRFGNVLGSNGSVIPRFSKQIEEGGPVTVTHRDIIRYFMTIPEACSLVLEAGCMGDGGEIYIFDMGKPIRIYDLACRMISLAGLRVGEDIRIIETGLRPGEKLYEELLNDKETTMATLHKKIMIAKVRTYSYSDVISHLDTLFHSLNTGNIHNLVSEMKLIVPEFKSQNSEWESIDKELKKEKAEQLWY